MKKTFRQLGEALLNSDSRPLSSSLSWQVSKEEMKRGDSITPKQRGYLYRLLRQPQTHDCAKVVIERLLQGRLEGDSSNWWASLGQLSKQKAKEAIKEIT